MRIKVLISEILRRLAVRRKQSTARHLLQQLESLDDSLTSRSAPSKATSHERQQQRAAIREKIVALGPDVIFTVLKYSRHEGWYYREEVFKIMSALAGDVVRLFIDGLFSRDFEVSWSSMKWLRDKGEGDLRAIAALIAFIKDPPHKDESGMIRGWAVEPLEQWGDIGLAALVDLALDNAANDEARLAALCCLDASELSQSQRHQLELIVSDPLEGNEVRELVRDKLRESFQSECE